MEHQERTPFDEQAALAELERFRRDIERERAKRKEVSEEFEEFIRSFKSADEVFPPGTAEPSTEFITSSYESATPFSAPRETRPAAEPAAPPRPRARTTVTIATVVILSAIGFATWKQRSRPAPPPAREEVAAPAAAPVPEPAPAPPPASTESVLTTSRPAWVRIIADGERVLERELPADARVPLTAQRTIVIRTGDAGAVRVSIAGQDQGSLGRTGEVVTRSFTVPGAEVR